EQERICLPPDRARQQHRPLPAGRTQARHHSGDPRGAARVSPSGHDRHQIGADPARSRHPGRDGPPPPGHGRYPRDDDRPAAGATSAAYTLLRLPLELKDLFKEWLEEHFPAKAAHVLSLVAQTHGGQLYNSAWFKRKTGTGPYADVLRLRFERACRKLGFNERTRQPLDTRPLQPPPRTPGPL